MARLYIVSTPIGNLADLTYRAVQVLGEVDRILAEDTRRTAILIRHYGIATPLVSLHAFNEAARVKRVLGWLAAGEALALVSDAGTPLLSDPGARIVQQAVEAGHTIIPVPGASALLAALVASGLEPEPFTFYGFLPRRGRGRAAALAAAASSLHTAVFYEAPGRIVELLQDLAEQCGPTRRVVVARELTKVHETFFRGTLEAAVAYYGREAPRGEVVVLVAGRAGAAETTNRGAAEAAVAAAARALLREGKRPSAIARELGRRFAVPRNRAYEIVLAIAGDEDRGKAS